MDTQELTWIIPITLLIIATLQLLYLFWLSATLNRKRRRKQPQSPIMPTNPQGHSRSLFDTDGVPLQEGSIGKIVVLRGLSSMTEIPLPSNEFGVGRFYNPEGNILVALDERSVSRRHATFVGDAPTREYYLTDTNSSYGTRIQINNQFEPLTSGKSQRIYNEDVVQFGNVIAVRFILPCQTRPAGARMY
jgi:pSer/pThr/pTyr-binding forkhead associated (FHA) protein